MAARRLCWVLSRSPRVHSTRRLIEAGQAHGFQMVVVDPMAPAVDASRAGPPRLLGVPANKLPHVVVPRIGAQSARASLVLPRTLAALGIPVLNHVEGILLARDKVATMQALAAKGIATPPTVVVRHPDHLAPALKKLGGLPVVLKTVQGTGGVGVLLVETRQELDAHAMLLWSAGEQVVLQRFLAEAKAADTRVLVVGRRVVAAMERRARRGEFRANVHQGGRTRAVELDAACRAMAVAAARVVGLGVCGVDIMQSRRGPVVLEVNASPGLKGIEGATGVDVAGAIMALAARLAAASR